MPRPSELLHIAELVKLAAETARACSAVSANGKMSRIAEIAQRISEAAQELENAARDIDRNVP